MSTEDFDTMEPGDDELFAGLHRSVAGATMTASAADVVALGRRTRNRHRAVAAGIGTSAAAIVAAIGVLAPSTGSGAGVGGVPSAAGQGAVGTTPAAPGTSSSGQVLTIQEAGFSLEEHADGTVLLSLDDIFDPAKVQAAMDRAGIPAAILVRQVPDDWDMKGRLIQCTPDPGVSLPPPNVQNILKETTPGRPSPKLVFNKSEIPAGDYVTLERFESHGRIVGGVFGIRVGRQTTCVLEDAVRPKPAK